MIMVTYKDGVSVNLDAIGAVYVECNNIVFARRDISTDDFNDAYWEFEFDTTEAANDAYKKILKEINENRDCRNLVIEVDG